MTALNPATIVTPLESGVPKWQRGTWEDYLTYRDAPTLERVRVFFNKGYFFIELGNESISHAAISDLLTIIFAIWFARKPGVTFSSLGRCVIEKPKRQAAAPDQILYVGENAPRWQEGEPRPINLNQWRVPDLVGEVADTTLATDLDEKKQIYAALEIPEYWVTDVRGKRVLAFQLQEDGNYQQCEYSGVLEGLPIAVLNGTLERLIEGDHASATLWFNQQIAAL